MRKNIIASVVFAAVAFAAPCSRAEPADRDPVMTAYRDALLAQLGKLGAAMPDMTRSAEAAAAKLFAGGNLYAGGQAAFVTEAFDRSGGFMMLDELTGKTVLTGKDVLLVGAWTNDDEAALEACRRGKTAGACVVLFSPAFEQPAPPLAALCDEHVVNFSPTGGMPIPAGDLKRNLPTSCLYDVTTLWTWTGELIGACTRKGKMPVIYQGVAVPRARARNAKYEIGGLPVKLRFHDDLYVPPQPPGWLGGQYLDLLRREIGGFRGAVLDELAAVAALAADAVRAGRTVHVQAVAHATVYEVKAPGVPAWMRAWDPNIEPESLVAAMKPGDVFFEVGYTELRPPFVEAVRKAGGKSVIALCHSPEAPLDCHPDFLIDTQWVYGDSSVRLPEYDVRILPDSGVLQMTLFWTVVAKAEQLRQP